MTELTQIEKETLKKNSEIKSIRMPSEGQQFKLLDTKFIVIKSSGFIFKAKALK